MAEYDIFISYRHQGGEQAAKTLHDRLKDKGYKVFLDVDALRSGPFDTRLYDVIDMCSDFILILSPNALDRCANEEDWVRLEITHALAKGKNVVPVFLKGFSYPKMMPNDVASLPTYHGVDASIDFYEAFLKKLCEFLKSKPTWTKIVKNNLSVRRSLMAVVLLIVITFGVWGGYNIFSQLLVDTYPDNKEERAELQQLTSFVGTNLSFYDRIMASMNAALRKSDDYIVTGTQEGYNELLQFFEYTVEQMEKQQIFAEAYNAQEIDYDKTIIPAEDIDALKSMYSIYVSTYKERLNYLAVMLSPDYLAVSAAEGKRMVAINEALVGLDAEGMLVNSFELFVSVNESALEEYRDIYLTDLSVMSEYLGFWTLDHEKITNMADAVYKRQNDLITEYATLTGDMAQDNTALAAKIASVEAGQEALNQTKEELDEAKASLREKFTPKEGDDPEYVWGCALRFLSVNMYEDAVRAFQFYGNQQREDEDVQVYTPIAIKFVEQISTTGIDYGIIAVMNEPDLPENQYINIGDIIIAVNGTMVMTLDDYIAVKETLREDEVYTLTMLRGDDTGNLNFQEVIVDRSVELQQGRMAYHNLCEILD